MVLNSIWCVFTYAFWFCYFPFGLISKFMYRDMSCAFIQPHSLDYANCILLCILYNIVSMAYFVSMAFYTKPNRQAEQLCGIPRWSWCTTFLLHDCLLTTDPKSNWIIEVWRNNFHSTFYRINARIYWLTGGGEKSNPTNFYWTHGVQTELFSGTAYLPSITMIYKL